ncbi:MAG: excisionase family DNA-binding protein [Ruminococcus sp.]|nr:excisionase family DNA-binding protein [Ruminococcus sp.]
MDQRQPQRRPQPRSANSAAVITAALILGISIIIAGVSVSGSLKKLTEEVKNQTFTSTFNSPASLTVSSGIPKEYFTVKEAALYLNMSEDEITTAIANGDIEEYIRTGSGYSISKDKLDGFFEQKAYDTMKANNASE